MEEWLMSVPGWVVYLLTIILLLAAFEIAKRSNPDKVSAQRKIFGISIILIITAGAIWLIFKQFFP